MDRKILSVVFCFLLGTVAGFPGLVGLTTWDTGHIHNRHKNNDLFRLLPGSPVPACTSLDGPDCSLLSPDFIEYDSWLASNRDQVQETIDAVKKKFDEAIKKSSGSNTDDKDHEELLKDLDLVLNEALGAGLDHLGGDHFEDVQVVMLNANGHAIDMNDPNAGEMLREWVSQARNKDGPSASLNISMASVLFDDDGFDPTESFFWDDDYEDDLDGDDEFDFIDEEIAALMGDLELLEERLIKDELDDVELAKALEVLLFLQHRLDDTPDQHTNDSFEMDGGDDIVLELDSDVELSDAEMANLKALLGQIQHQTTVGAVTTDESQSADQDQPKQRRQQHDDQ